jgi:hypothetical protein
MICLPWQAPEIKIFLFFRNANQCNNSFVPPDKRGGSRRHERAVGCGGRGVRNRRGRMTRTAKSCGPDAPMAGVKLPRSSRFLGATVTSKLWSRRGEHEISCKPSRREGRMFPLNLYARVRLLYASLHTRSRVQRAPGLPCALYLLGADEFANLGRKSAARMRMHVCELFDN